MVNPKVIVAAASVAMTACIFAFCTEQVKQGTVKAAYRYGDYQYNIGPGFHFVSPLNAFHTVDTKQKTYTIKNIELPSQDQLLSTADVSVQYRAIAGEAQTIISDTGNMESTVKVHLEPIARSSIRRYGKTVEKAEDFFKETTQMRLQEDIRVALDTFMTTKGVTVTNVLIRNTRLPEFIQIAIQRKKDNEQKAQQQVAELERYNTEQQQLVSKATAAKEAAVQLAEQKKLLADAEAYQIQKEGEMLEQFPSVLKFRALDALMQMSKDPAAKIYWMDSNSANPLPLMHLGESK